MNTIIPALSSIVALIFAVAVLDQYLERRKPYQLVWSIGLFMYFLSTGSEFLIELSGVSPGVYRLWYLTGAIYVAAYLGMGTVYLLARRSAAHIVLGILVAASLYALVRVAAAPLDFSVLPAGGPISGKAFPISVRLITPIFNVFGTIALVGGALYSAWIFWRRHILRHRVISNVLVAAGAMLPAAGGTASRLGEFRLLYALELLGIVVIFIGFLRSNEVFGIRRIPFTRARPH